MHILYKYKVVSTSLESVNKLRRQSLRISNIRLTEVDIMFVVERQEFSIAVVFFIKHVVDVRFPIHTNGDNTITTQANT